MSTTAQRRHHFDFPLEVQQLAATLRTPTNQLGFLLSWGYFTATKQFFLPQTFRPLGIEYVARHLGLENGELMSPGASTEDHRLRAERTRVHGAGRFLTAEAVLTLDAGFTLTCAGRTVRGSVTTWQQSFAQDAFRCGTDPGTDAWAREAYERGCGPLGS